MALLFFCCGVGLMAGIMQKLMGKVLKIGGESGKRMRIIQPFDKVFVSLRLNNL